MYSSENKGVMHTEDVLILNGCCIRLPGTGNAPLTIRYGGHNMIRFSILDHVISIDDIRFSSRDILYTMLEALSRYAYLIAAAGIALSPDIPLYIVTILDDHGILDRLYQ